MRKSGSISVAVAAMIGLVAGAYSQVVSTPVFSSTDPHWMKPKNMECWVYVHAPVPGETAKVEGGLCYNGLVQGDLLELYDANSKKIEEDYGNIFGGLMQGPIQHSVLVNGYWSRTYGNYVDGRPEGPQVPGSEMTPLAQRAPQAESPQNTPPANVQPVQTPRADDLARQADIRAATRFWLQSANAPGSIRLWYKWLRDDPSAAGMDAKSAVAKYLFLAFLSDRKNFTLDPSQLPFDARIAGAKRALAWNQERLDFLSANPSTPQTIRNTAQSIKIEIEENENTISSLEKDQKRDAETEASEEAFRRSLPKLYAERKKVGDLVCSDSGRGIVDEVSGDEIVPPASQWLSPG